MDEIVRDFLVESKDNLDRLDQELVRLETDPSSTELLKSIFRTIHTIKGSCGFLGFSHLEKVAHAGESLLSKLRDKELQLNSEITSGLLAMVDAVRRMLGEIEATEHDGDNEYPELIEQLKKLQQANASSSGTPVENLPQPSSSSPDAVKVENPEPQTKSSKESQAASAEPAAKSAPPTGTSPPARKSRSAQLKPSPGKIGGMLVDRGAIRPEDLALALQEQEAGDRRRLGEILVALKLCRQEEVDAAQQVLESRPRETVVETVRVTVDVLDTLMNLVGELVLARNQLLQFAPNVADTGFHAVSQRMNLIATELQAQVMKTRMQPIGNVWNKFPRTVRDLALNCGKEVHLEMEGQNTELDRTIIEAIKDPLTHLVRNSIDHGIEAPDIRKQLGKDPCGRLKLRAFHEGGQVNIEISDDGAGLNVELIRKKAQERGVITAQQAARMPDHDIFNLIFLPGFSTAQKVTNVSGRGVGMDVVKTNIEKIGGMVELQSILGQSTTVRVKIPLTLAIVPALVVRCCGQRFAIPQVSLTELVRCEAGKGIESVHGSPVYRLRGRILPLIYLAQVLKPQQAVQSQNDQEQLGDPAHAQANVNIAVLQADGQQFGLVVDEILDTQEIVVKPLAKQLKGISAYAGATIMGDGRVALILDVMGLAEQAKLTSEARESLAQEHAQEAQVEHQLQTDRALLIAQNGSLGRVAIPLSLVSRLEKFPATAVERAGRQEVMQYRGQVIPVVKLWNILADGMEVNLESANTIQVVIYSDQGRTVGLLVDRIIDIVHEYGALESLAPRLGVTGTLVAQQHVTELLDVPAIVKAAIPGTREEAQAVAAGG